MNRRSLTRRSQASAGCELELRHERAEAAARRKAAREAKERAAKEAAAKAAEEAV